MRGPVIFGPVAAGDGGASEQAAPASSATVARKAMSVDLMMQGA
jgi:hypothetical protein